MANKPAHRSGIVSILGRPNAGKSTLLNALAGVRLAIVSDKPQTTRTAVRAIVTTPEAQIVFVDTPGIHRSDTTLNRHMMRTVRSALDDLDLLVLVADGARPFEPADTEAIDLIKKAEAPAILALNKIDRLKKDKSPLLALLEQYRTLHDFAEYIPISAVTGEGLDDLRRAIVGRLPKGPAIYPANQQTDVPERFLAAEFIREKVLAMTHQEVPHAAGVVVDKWEDKRNLLRIAATIFVEREGQKAILIGAGGATLKRIGTGARKEIEAFFGKKVFLELFVKVVPRWRENVEFLNEIDWRRMIGTEHE